jgi:hypothetical protein
MTHGLENATDSTTDCQRILNSFNNRLKIAKWIRNWPKLIEKRSGMHICLQKLAATKR